MALNYERIMAHRPADIPVRYGERDCIIYALGIGLGMDPADPGELKFVYERAGLDAFPTMAVVLGWPGRMTDPAFGVDDRLVVAGDIKVVLHRPLAAEGKLLSRPRIKEVIDKGAGNAAIIQNTRDLIAEDGPSSPPWTAARSRASMAASAARSQRRRCRPRCRDRAPERFAICRRRPISRCSTASMATRTRCMPIPRAPRSPASIGPILHGAASFGVAAHAILRTCADYRPERLHSIEARFSRPVFPGETLRTEIWPEREHILFRCRMVGRDEIVLSNGLRDVADLTACRYRPGTTPRCSWMTTRLTAPSAHEVRDWIGGELPADLCNRSTRIDPPELKPWHRKLYERGWIAPHWPKEYGGMGATLTQQIILFEEIGRVGAPTPYPHGLNFIGPMIIDAGTPEQKAKHLPPILSGEATWCQGYSEAGAGSDLASLQTRAVLDGDHFVVNGHKMWTTNGHYADWMFALVRTDPDAKPRHAGITMLLIDMNSPGITVRPIQTMKGDAEFAEEFFDDVRVPKENMLGRAQRRLAHRQHGCSGSERFTTGHPRNAAVYSTRRAQLAEHHRRLGRCRLPAPAGQCSRSICWRSPPITATPRGCTAQSRRRPRWRR